MGICFSKRKVKDEKSKDHLKPKKATWVNRVCYILDKLIEFLYLVSLFMFIMGLYVIISDWGKVVNPLFNRFGTILTLVGALFMSTNILGQMIIDLDKKGANNTKKMLLFYVIVVIFFLVFLFVLLFLSYSNLNSLNSSYNELNAGNDPGLGKFETSVGDNFNQFFFAATQSCSANYMWLWVWVDSYCPDNLNIMYCRGCFDFSLTFCPADGNTCPVSNVMNTDTTCPYILCRKQLLGYVINRFKMPFYYVIIGFIVIYFLILVLCLILIFFENEKNMTIQVVPLDDEMIQLLSLSAMEHEKNQKDSNKTDNKMPSTSKEHKKSPRSEGKEGKKHKNGNHKTHSPRPSEENNISRDIEMANHMVQTQKINQQPIF